LQGSVIVNGEGGGDSEGIWRDREEEVGEGSGGRRGGVGIRE